MQSRSSKSTGRKSRSMKTCGRSRRKASGALTSSAAASLVRTSASLEKVPVSPVLGPVFGTSSLGSLARYDPDMCSWRTWQRCLLEEWEPFSVTFPRSGMTQNGTLFQLQPLVRRTGGSECGSLPTPTTKANQMCPSMMSRGVACRNLRAAMFPTPKASAAGPDFAKVGRSKTGISLATAVAMWPTPQAADRKATGQPGTKSHANHLARGSLLTAAVTESTGGGSLNPTWVEWLMGFPLGWTALDASATPLSRRSLKSSGEQSLTENGG